jgi:cytochrome P450
VEDFRQVRFLLACNSILDLSGTPNRNGAAFGLGIHRCVGSNLARMEIRVALTEWLARFPEFCLNPDLRVTWSIGTVRGPRQLPLLLA